MLIIFTYQPVIIKCAAAFSETDGRLVSLYKWNKLMTSFAFKAQCSCEKFNSQNIDFFSFRFWKTSPAQYFLSIGSELETLLKIQLPVVKYE
jgi:hypothetical protein